MSPIAYEQSEALTYDRPPLVEVACGVGFARLEEFLIPHYGLFWHPIRDEFPTCQHAGPVGELGDEGGNVWPLPRVWFLSRNEDRLIQLQSNRFAYNWRRSEWHEYYPRFDHVYSCFEEYYSKFRNFVAERNIGTIKPTDYELTYINHIFQGEGWNRVSDISTLLKDLSWSNSDSRFLGEPDSLSWQANFSLPDSLGILSAQLKHGTRRADGTPVYLLHLVAKGLPKSETDADRAHWFQVAHDCIVNGFKDLTPERTQVELWHRQ